MNATPTLRRPPFLFPTAEEMKEQFKDIPRIPDIATMIFDNARATAKELEGKNIPAADLTDSQKCALFTLAGFMKYENGRMVSIRQVGITDRGDGGYLLAIAPEERA
jgi:hypothetical protein